MSSYDAAIRNNIRDPFYRDKHETERRAQEMKRNQEREEQDKQWEKKWAAEDAIKKGEKETWKTAPGKSLWGVGGKSKKLSQKKKRKTLRKKRKLCKK
jgi:hypothetical protein